MAITVLIPALNPAEPMLGIVAALAGSDKVTGIILVDDGSSEAHQSVFQAAAAQPKVTLLRHATNLGKGAALRTGLNHFLCLNQSDGVLVTADANGRHLPKDILEVGATAENSPDKLVLGSRALSGDLPWHRRFGDNVTRLIFSCLTGRRISDAQSGLRAIPRALMAPLLRLKTNGREFDLEMLVTAAGEQIPTASVSIERIDLEERTRSRFNPLLDSMRIYFVFARFLSSSLVTAAVDYLVFSAVYHLSRSISWGILAGRLVAGSLNFGINKRYVFHSRAAVLRTLARYAALVAALGFVAWLTIDFLCSRWGWNPYLAKISVESLLLLGSFVMQRDLVFARRVFAPPDENSEATDWDAYYARPYASARFTRRVTAAMLVRLINRFGRSQHGPVRIVELGGANSCFYDHLMDAVAPLSYDVVDNNESGLEAFRQRIHPGSSSTAHSMNVLSSDVSKLAGRYDVCFSVGLVEHFDAAGTMKAIASHFTLLRPGGIAIITYPTPTWLYRATRFLAEKTGNWIFWDERPLREPEVLAAARPHADLLHREINWWVVLTQGVVVARKFMDDPGSKP